MAITKKRKIGDKGEDVACKYLERRGFKVLERNFLKKCGELDIIAEKDEILHFIEVKSVSREILPGNQLGKKSKVSHETTGYRPEENINREKIGKIKKTIRVYLMERSLEETHNWSFGVITVFLDFKRKIARVNMIKDIIL